MRVSEIILSPYSNKVRFRAAPAVSILNDVLRKRDNLHLFFHHPISQDSIAKRIYLRKIVI